MNTVFIQQALTRQLLRAVEGWWYLRPFCFGFRLPQNRCRTVFGEGATLLEAQPPGLREEKASSPDKWPKSAADQY